MIWMKDLTETWDLRSWCDMIILREDRSLAGWGDKAQQSTVKRGFWLAAFYPSKYTRICRDIDPLDGLSSGNLYYVLHFFILKSTCFSSKVTWEPSGCVICSSLGSSVSIHLFQSSVITFVLSCFTQSPNCFGIGVTPAIFSISLPFFLNIYFLAVIYLTWEFFHHTTCCYVCTFVWCYNSRFKKWPPQDNQSSSIFSVND